MMRVVEVSYAQRLSLLAILLQSRVIEERWI